MLWLLLSGSSKDWLRIMQAYAFSAKLFHLHSREGVGLAVALNQHFSVAQHLAGIVCSLS